MKGYRANKLGSYRPFLFLVSSSTAPKIKNKNITVLEIIQNRVWYLVDPRQNVLLLIFEFTAVAYGRNWALKAGRTV